MIHYSSRTEISKNIQGSKHPTSFLKRSIVYVLAAPAVAKFARRVLELQDWFIIPTNKEQKEVVRHIKEIKMDVRMALNNQEAYQIYITAKNAHKIEGEFAEVGVFKGGSARLISEVKGDKKLYLFDTFEGLPPLKNIDKEHFSEGMLAAEYDKVSAFFLDDKNVIVSKGLFPSETGHVVDDKKFAFVHLDVDLYQGTKDCLEYFYPKMSRGGIILSHDYVTIPGVRKAFDDFFSDKMEVILEPSRSQALVVKR